MKKRWVIRQQDKPEVVRNLARALNIDEHLAALLVQRNVRTYEEAREFFRPDLKQLHDPFLMKDMDKAVDRIERAIAQNEKILIYGDYDVDGTTAVALVYTFLKQFYDALDFYIPDRYAEGYGISCKGIDHASDQGVSLIIVLDCGIKAIEKINYAKGKDLDFIICDHHRPGKEIPDAEAVLDPKRPDCNYPFKELSGCGVGFKLIQAYAQKNKLPSSSVFPFLDLVVVSIAADIVPITGENRTLAYYGLQTLNSTPRPGIEAILKCAGIKKIPKENGKFNFDREIGISDLVFLVGPRINATGRIKDAKDSVKLLITGDAAYAKKMAAQVNTLNTERKTLDLKTTQEALDMIQQDPLLQQAKSTVVFNPDWHKGVIGIVASRLTESHYKPTIVLTLSNNLVTGSARSIKNFDIYDAIDACSDLLEHFGGHKYAAGLSLKPENLEEFRHRFEEYVINNINAEMMIPEVEIDDLLILKNINSRFFRILKQFSPFGPGNPSPVFQTNGLTDSGKARIVGKNHLKLELYHPDISGGPFSAIAFQQGHHFERISTGEPFNICYHIEENEWNGRRNLQLNIRDISFNEVKDNSSDLWNRQQ